MKQKQMGDLTERIATVSESPSEHLTEQEKEAARWMDAWDEYCDEDLTCEACGGSGADAMEGFMPCEECDGEGYRWWE